MLDLIRIIPLMIHLVAICLRMREASFSPIVEVYLRCPWWHETRILNDWFLIVLHPFSFFLYLIFLKFLKFKPLWFPPQFSHFTPQNLTVFVWYCGHFQPNFREKKLKNSISKLFYSLWNWMKYDNYVFWRSNFEIQFISG